MREVGVIIEGGLAVCGDLQHRLISIAYHTITDGRTQLLCRKLQVVAGETDHVSQS